MQGKTSSPNLSDREIVDLFWNRDESAIPETDRKYGEELFRIAYRILSDPSECEACKNEIYLKVWNSIPPARPDVLASYLSRLIRNVALDRYREREFRARLTSDVTEAMREYNETIPAGKVIRQYPKADEEVMPGSTVVLTVSLGPTPPPSSEPTEPSSEPTEPSSEPTEPPDPDNNP